MYFEYLALYYDILYCEMSEFFFLLRLYKATLKKKLNIVCIKTTLVIYFRIVKLKEDKKDEHNTKVTQVLSFEIKARR